MSSTPKNWSFPRSPGFGMVWMGLEQATKKDIIAIYDYLTNPHAAGAAILPGMDPKDVNLDTMTLVGRYGRSWNTLEYFLEGKRHPNGGEGSDVYENQYLGDGVKMSKEAVWCYPNYDSDDLDKRVPVGGYHYADSRGTNVEGPEPGSEAEKLLGDGYYVWDEHQALYLIK